MIKTLLDTQHLLLNRRVKPALFMSIVSICLLVGFHVTNGYAKTVELTMASLFPPGSTSAKSLERWVQKIEEDSHGTLTIRHYPSNTLIAASDMRSGVKMGIADLGASFVYKPEPGFEPTMFLAQMIRGQDYDSCLNIIEDIFKEFPELWADQWKDFKLIWLTTADPNRIVTIKKPVHTIADMEGLQIRIPTAKTAEIIKQLGAIPVSMSSADWIVAIDKGMVSGAATSMGGVYDYKIGEKIKYVTRFSTGPGLVFLTMNKNSYNKLSPEHKKIIDNSMQMGKDDFINTKKTELKTAIDYLKNSGVEFIDLPAEEMKKWEAQLQPVFDGIAAELDKKGFPGTKLMNYALERADFYNAQNMKN
ncbi:TRAP transporter substrate-binding protein DctP [Desulfocastanea catecholica]